MHPLFDSINTFLIWFAYAHKINFISFFPGTNDSLHPSKLSIGTLLSRSRSHKGESLPGRHTASNPFQLPAKGRGNQLLIRFRGNWSGWAANRISSVPMTTDSQDPADMELSALSLPTRGECLEEKRVPRSKGGPRGNHFATVFRLFSRLKTEKRRRLYLCSVSIETLTSWRMIAPNLRLLRHLTVSPPQKGK